MTKTESSQENTQPSNQPQLCDFSHFCAVSSRNAGFTQFITIGDVSR